MLSCSACTTPPAPPVATNRPCYQWVITQDQEVYVYVYDKWVITQDQEVYVYVYDNGHLVARLETEPYDAVISGWCIMRNNEHLMNDIRRLARPTD